MSITTTTFRKPLRLTLILALIAGMSVSVSACSMFQGNGKAKTAKVDKTRGLNADQIYQRAKTALNNGEYQNAINLYESLEAKYPLGRYAQQAQLESAYAYYKFDEPDTALDMIDRFIRMNPVSPKVDYALYLRGLVNFNRGGSIVDKLFPRSIADLDTVRQKESFHDFSRLVNRYPNSRYASDARQRIQYLRNSLAQTEVNVAKHYMKRSAYLAAFNRAEYTIKHYQGSPAVIEALEIKVKAATRLGKTDLAADSLRVLSANFPQRAAKLQAQLR